MDDSTEKQIHDTVVGIKLDVKDIQKDQQHTTEAVNNLCGELKGYAKGTEKRLGIIEGDLGNRNPNDPTAFSQLQSHTGSLSRIGGGVKIAWGFITATIAALAAQLFGLFGK